MHPLMTETRQLLDWSFIATLVGGVLVIVGGLWMLGMMSFMTGAMPMFSRDGPDAAFGLFGAFMTVGGIISIIAGAVGLVAAAKIRASSDNASTWGTVAIVAGALSLLGMGGGMVGAAALIGGGAMAVTAAGRAREAT